MINFIDSITDFVLKAFFEIYRVFLIIIVSLVLMFGEFETNNIIYCSFIIILLSYVLSNIILRKSNKESKLHRLLIIAGIIINAIILIFLFDYLSIYLKISIFTYFLLIWLQGIKIAINNNNNNTESYILKFIISIVIIICLGSIVCLTNIDFIKTFLQNHLFSYFFIALILIARISLYSAYSGNRKITINKKKNTLIFSIITNFLIVTISLFSFYSKSYLKSIFKYLSRLLLNLIQLFITLLYNIWNFLVEMFIKEPQNLENERVKNESLISNLMEIIKDWESTGNPFFINILNILKRVLIFLIISLIIIFLLYNIYKISRHIFKNKTNDGEEDEIKDFVLSKKDILNNLKNPFNKLSKNISKLFNKDKSLHIIRQIYIDIIIMFYKKGYEFKKSFTPNEYIETIEKNAYKELISLTKYYNIIRYSNKNITDEEISNAIKIKNEIKKVNGS